MITLLLLVRATYMHGVVLHGHPVRGESHNHRNTSGEVATLLFMYASTIVATAGEKLFLASSVTREQQPEGKWTSQDNELKFNFYLTKGGCTEYHTNTIRTKQVKFTGAKLCIS